MIRARLLRHGQSESNVGKRTDWPGDVQLTEMGRRQATLLANHVFPETSMVVVSKYIRTSQTAEPLLARLDSSPVTWTTWPVHEYTYLDVQRCSRTTPEDRAPLRQSYWDRMDSDYVDGEGAESFSQFQSRAYDLIERLRNAPKSDGCVDVFTHADFIRMVIFNVLVPRGDQSMSGFQQFCRAVPIPNTACVRVQIDGSRISISGPDVSHLPTSMISV